MLKSGAYRLLGSSEWFFVALSRVTYIRLCIVAVFQYEAWKGQIAERIFDIYSLFPAKIMRQSLLNTVMSGSNRNDIIDFQAMIG